MVVKTPSGFEVHIKDNFTYGDYRKIVKSFLKTAELDINKSTEDKIELKNLTGDRLLEYQEYALDVLIVKIVRGGKEITSNFKEEIYTWPVADGQMINKEMSKIIGNKGEKK